jgi:hypothetical protein
MAAEIAIAAPARRRWPRVLLRVLLSLFAFCALATAVIGWLHTATGRVVYAKVFGARCPVGRANPQDVERGRREVARQVRGTARAASRPALGFRLDESTRAEVDAWATRHGVSCRERREGTLLMCTAVPSAALGRAGAAVDEVSFGFAPNGMRLVNLTAVRYRLSPSDAVAWAGGLLSSMRAAVGAPTRQAGPLDAQALGAGPYATSAAFFEYSDYIADITATNIPTDGVLVREHYMSAVD